MFESRVRSIIRGISRSSSSSSRHSCQNIGICNILRWAREKEWGKIRYYSSLYKNCSDESIENEKVSIYEQDEKERRAIHWCCVHVAPFDVFLYILKKGGRESLTKDATGMTPLHLLCLNRAPLLFVRQIIEEGNERDIWEEDRKKNSPLDIACQTRAPYDVICYLMELREETTTLFRAMSEKNWEEAEQYLTESSDSVLTKSSSCVTHDSYFPDSNYLHWACMFGAPIFIFKLLLDKGLDPKKRDEKGRTPLHLACYKQLNIDIVEILIKESEDDLFEEDDEGLTPLIVAFTFNKYTVNTNVIHRLRTIEEYKTNSNFSQLFNLVLDEDWKNVRKYLIDTDISKTKKRTSVCFRAISSKKSDRNCLHWACRYSAPKDIIHLLIKYGSRYSVSYADAGGRTPLHIACQRDAPLEVIKALVQVYDLTPGSYFLTSLDKGGLTPLANACVSGASIEIIEYLLKCEGLEKALRSELNNKNNLLDILLLKPTPTRIVDFIQQKWIEIDPFMAAIPSKTVEKSLEWTRRKNGNTVYCFNGKFIRTILNEHFIRKDVLFILMADFYIQLILVTIFTIGIGGATPSYFLLVICEIWIMFREFFQLCTTPFNVYIVDIWNFADLIQICSLGMFICEAEEERNRVTEICANGFVWVCLIGVLKTMNYRIGILINAFIQISFELIPFVVVTFLLLGSFANMFNVASHITNNNTDQDDCKTIFDSSSMSTWMVKTTAMLMTDEWFPISEIDNGKISPYFLALSLIYGLVMGILIINVLIAKINNVFSEVDAKGRNFFWDDRLSFVVECKQIVSLKRFFKNGNISYTLKHYSSHSKRLGVIHDNDIDYINPVENDVIQLSNHRHMASILNTPQPSENILPFHSLNDKLRRFNFSLASTKEIKEWSTISERKEFFYWWMQPDLWETPTLKTRLTVFIEREEFSEMLLPSQTFERILSGKEDKQCYLLTYFLEIFLIIPCILIVFLLGLISFGLLWPTFLKELLFFGPNEYSQDITNQDLSKNVTTMENRIKSVDDEIVAVKESLNKINNMFSKILDRQDDVSYLSSDDSSALVA